jgi:hypothetical protein
MYDEQFPHQIDLGRDEPDYGPAAIPAETESPRKTRKFYPTLYIDAIEGMPALPKEGCMMVKFRRKRMSVEENMDGKETSGMTLEIRKLCLPEDMAEEGDDMQDAMKKFAAGEGVDTESDADAAEEDDED